MGLCETSLTPPSLFQLALEKYEEMFPAFTDSRECKLLKVSKEQSRRERLGLFRLAVARVAHWSVIYLKVLEDMGRTLRWVYPRLMEVAAAER